MAAGLILCLLLYLYSVNSSDVICEQGFCRSYQFDTGCIAPAQECRINNATHSGIWLPSPTTCNCCEFCLPLYGEGELCSKGGPGTGFTVGRCGDGLACVDDPDGGHSLCKRMQSECHTKQDEYDARLARGDVGAMEMKPHCDGKGKYAPYDCVPAQTCFCQTEQGQRIFGEVQYLGTVTTQNMHCGCSRIHDKIRRNISPGLSIPVVGPRCTADGSYHPVQCVGRRCYCVDTVTGAVLGGHRRSIDLDDEPLTELACYDPSLDLFPHQTLGPPPYNYTTPCLEDMQARVDLIQQSKEEGYNVEHASSVPECMPDGTYGRVVRKSSGERICVDERGRQIENYEAQNNTPEFDSMDCKCAQTALIMASSAEKPVCCKNGNFRRIQCRRGFCYCVDSDGRQTAKESTDVTRLPCYTSDWRTC